MTCREVNEYILDYRSGHLSPEECACGDRRVKQ